MHSLAYFIRESFIGFKRNFSTAFGSIVTIFLSLFIIGVFLVGAAMVSNIVKQVESEISITIYVSDDYDINSTQVNSLATEIRSMEGVSSVTATTKDQALEDFRNSMTSNPEIVDQLDGQNPLPASLDIELTDAELVSQVAGEIENSSTFKTVCKTPDAPSDSIKYGQKTVEQLLDVIQYVRYIGIALIILLIVVALIFINNTIRLAILARRKEISIMRLVGASNGFIRGPFLMEAVLHSIIGVALSILGLELVRNFALTQLSNTFGWLPVDLSIQTFLLIYVVLLIAGLLIGLVGSAVSMRRYLKV
jgi:cell division transport system permease protein